jgi:hypothetical protein
MMKTMLPSFAAIFDQAKERARRFNEAEAFQHEFERLRQLRRLTAPRSNLPEDATDEFDWQHAMSICRQPRAISLHLS